MTENNGFPSGGGQSASGAPQPPAGYQSAQPGGGPSDTAYGQVAHGYGQSAQESGFSSTASYGGSGTSAYDASDSGTSSYEPVSADATVQDSGKKPGNGRTFLMGFAGAALACIIALGGFAVWQNMSGSGGSTVIGGSSSGTVTASEDDATLAEQVAQKALPSVAAIDVYTEQSSMYGMYGYGSSGSGQLTETSLGSGVVISEDGYIITNYHVIEGADALVVTIDGQEYDAEVVGSDSSSDLAVVKAQNASGLTAIELGDSDNLSIGEWVMSIGSPFGLEQSVATGIVSATNRSQIIDSSTNAYGQSESTVYTNMIQTDAAINPGNSGGALVDSEGKLIGINTLITSYSGNYSGVGFAIPVNYAVSIAQQIIDGETPSHAQLGVTMSTVNSQLADRYGFAVDQGAYVSAVQQGSGAAEAGIQAGDIITKFDGQEVASASDLTLAVRGKNVGDTASVEVNRSGQTLTLEVTLGSDSSSQESSTQQQSGSSVLEQLLGGGSQQQGDAA